MEGLTLEGEGRITHRTDLPDPTVQAPTDAVVRVEAAGLCGSDLHTYEGREAARLGVVQGHEVVGHVMAVGADVHTVREGDRVVVPFTTSCGRCGPCLRGLSARCEVSQLFGWGDPDPSGAALDGGQASMLRVPHADGTLVVVGEDLPTADALLLSDNLPTGWYAALRAGVTIGATVAVVGLGSVGLCAVVSALAMGAERVIGIDPVAGRRDRAVTLGAEVSHPDQAAGVTVDAAVEAAGPLVAQQLAAALVRPGGAVSIIAVQTAPAFGISPVAAYDRNLTITAGRAPVRSLLPDILARIGAGDLVVPGQLILTHPDRPLSEGPDLYRRFADREPGLVKAAFTPR